MLIGEDESGYTVAFEARSIDDVLALDDGRDEELEFAAVAGLSEWATKTYELTWQPALRALVTPAAAEIRKRPHPLRLQHYFFSYRNPLFSNIGTLAEATHKHRAAADKNNPYLAFNSYAPMWSNRASRSSATRATPRSSSCSMAFTAPRG
jgi:hypothetical protein